MLNVCAIAGSMLSGQSPGSLSLSYRHTAVPAMALTPHIGYVSVGLLPGCRTWLFNFGGEQESLCMLCQGGAGSGYQKTFRVFSGLMGNSRCSGMPGFNNRHSFATLLANPANFNKQKRWKTEVQVAADYPDSKPDASSFLGDLGYHPLEEVPSFERKKNIELTDRRLTDAELARTLAEVNQDAIAYASLVDDEDHIFGTELQYLVDEHGDFYFQIDDDSEFLSTLNNEGSRMNIAVGYGSVEDWVLEQQEDHEGGISEDSEESDDDDDNKEDGEGWIILSAEDAELFLDLEEDSSESVGDWAGLDTLRYVHPMQFAEALAEAAVADHAEKIEKPSRSLRIIGDARRLNEDEEKYVQRLWNDRFPSEEEDDEDGEELTEQVEGVVTGLEKMGELVDEESPLLSSKENAAASLEGSGKNEQLMQPAEFTEIGSSFYKLDIQSIRVISGFGAKSTVDKLEFQAAKPDLLARSASAIMEHLNARGKSTEDALKALCLNRKGLEVEKVALIELDSLGMDLRVHCGREVQTLRISFSQRATSVEHAEELLNKLLYPRKRQRGRQRRQSCSQRKSL